MSKFCCFFYFYKYYFFHKRNCFLFFIKKEEKSFFYNLFFFFLFFNFYFFFFWSFFFFSFLFFFDPSFYSFGKKNLLFLGYKNEIRLNDWNSKSFFKNQMKQLNLFLFFKKNVEYMNSLVYSGIKQRRLNKNWLIRKQFAVFSFPSEVLFLRSIYSDSCFRIAFFRELGIGCRSFFHSRVLLK